ncbi:MAG: SPOR domain-containing protein [Phycisphaerales bacterium]|nr:SPOR domain-containing protein [Phycisphaerales bacterium]
MRHSCDRLVQPSCFRVLCLAAILFSSACAPRADTGLDSALASYDAGDFESAYDQAQSARYGGSSRDRTEAAYIGGLAATRLGRTGSARVMLEQATSSSDPEIAGRAGVTLGTVLLDDGEPLQAARTFDSAATHLHGEDLARTRMLAGIAYRDAGYAADARKRFDAASRSSSGDLGSRAANEISRTGFTIQAGAFSSKDSAVAHATTVSTAARPRGMPTATVVKSVRNGKVRWLVQIGNYPDRAVAQSNLDRLGGGLGNPYVTAISAN